MENGVRAKAKPVYFGKNLACGRQRIRWKCCRTIGTRVRQVEEPECKNATTAREGGARLRALIWWFKIKFFAPKMNRFLSSFFHVCAS